MGAVSVFLFLSLGASSTFAATEPFQIRLTDRTGQVARFDLDFGVFEIRNVQGSLDPRFPSIRLPASVSRSGLGRPEIDFSRPHLRVQVLNSFEELLFGKKPVQLAPKKEEVPRLVSLEPARSGRGPRLAQGELWLYGIAVRFTLMKSKWSAAPSTWWIAYPSQWVEADQRWEDLFVIKDRPLKKQILNLVRETFVNRYALAQ